MLASGDNNTIHSSSPDANGKVENNMSQSSMLKASSRSINDSYRLSGVFVQENQEIFNVIDPTVLQQQKEWEYLLHISGKDEKIPFSPQELFGDVKRKHMAAAVWVIDAIHARAVEYPRTDVELDRLTIARSAWLRNLFNLAAVYQIVAPFLNRPLCSVSSTTNGWDWFVNGGPPTLPALATFDIISLAIFSYDLYVNLSVNPSHKLALNKPWTVFRLLTTIFLFGAIISTFSGDYSAQLYLRCLFPFLLVSRRNNLKLMFQGLVHSIYYTFHVVFALSCLILMWGLVGFFLFRYIAATGSRFNTVSSAIFSALHCYTTRPFTLLALNDVFDNESLSALWFVTLTLFADVLCTAFIIAVGTRQYREFAANILKKRLLHRKKATFSVFEGFATSKGFLLKDWKRICTCISDPRYAVNEDTAEHIFALEDPERTGCLDIVGFMRCMGSLAARIQFRKGAAVDGVGGDNTPYDATHDSSNGLEDHSTNADDASDNHKLKVEMQSSVTSPFEEELVSPIHSEEREETGSKSARSNSLIKVVSKSTAERRIDKENPTSSIRMVMEVLPGGETGSNGAYNKTTNPRFETSNAAPKSEHAAVTSNKHRDLDVDSMPPYRRFKFDRYFGAFLGAAITSILIAWNKMLDFDVVIRFSWQNAWIVLSEFLFGPKERGLVTFVRYHIPVYDTIFVLVLHICLIIQLANISDPHASKNWHVFGWVLEGIFLFDMFMRLAVFGYRGLGKFQLARMCETFINVASFIAILVLASEHSGRYGIDDTQDVNAPSAALTIVIIIQSMRFFKLFFLVNDQDIFEDIYPTIFRALFILFSVIYFFAIFANSSFCGDMVISSAVLDADDDSKNWVEYANVLNFRSFAQSLFTMFELCTQSNWTIVMDVAAKQAGNRAFFFFYVYRLVLTLFVIPLLLSFIMNAFVTAVVKKDKRMHSRLEEEDHDNAMKGMTMDFNQNMGIAAEKDALAAHAKNPTSTSFTKADYDEFHDVKFTSRAMPSGSNSDQKSQDCEVPTVARSEMNLDTPKLKTGLRNALPTFSVDTRKSLRKTTEHNYEISSKSSNAQMPSMLSIWSGWSGDTANPAHQAAIKADVDKRLFNGKDDISVRSGSYIAPNNDANPRVSFSSGMRHSAIRAEHNNNLVYGSLSQVHLNHSDITDETQNIGTSSILQLQAQIAKLEAELKAEREKKL